MALSGGIVALIVCLTVLAVMVLAGVSLFLWRRWSKLRKRPASRRSNVEFGRVSTHMGAEPPVVEFGKKSSAASHSSVTSSLMAQSRENSLSSSANQDTTQVASCSSLPDSHISVSQASNGKSPSSQLSVTSSGAAIQACAEAVAEQARQRTSDSSVQEQPQPLANGNSSTLALLESSSKTSIEECRPRSISEVIPSKRRRVLQRREQRQKVMELSKMSKVEESPTARKETNAFLSRKKLLKKERSLSLPVISIDDNGACSFLLSDAESSDSDNAGKICNPYFSLARVSLSPSVPSRRDSEQSQGADKNKLNEIIDVATRLHAAGAAQILARTMSDPENDLNGSDDNGLYTGGQQRCGSKIVGRTVMSMRIPSQSGDGASGTAHSGKAATLPHGFPSNAAQPSIAGSPDPEPAGPWRRSARFKRSRHGSKRQRVRVVSRAVTFHSHEMHPQPFTPMKVHSQTSSLQSISNQRIRHSTEILRSSERKGSVVEVMAADVPDDEDTDATGSHKTEVPSVVVQPANTKNGTKLLLQLKASNASQTSQDYVRAPANSPVTSSDLLSDGVAVHRLRPSPVAIRKVTSQGSELPHLATNQQRRKMREESRQRCVAAGGYSTQTGASTMVGSPESQHQGASTDELESPFSNSAQQPLRALNRVPSTGTEVSASPMSVYSSDLRMDVYGTKPQGNADYCPLTDGSSSLNSKERESPV